MMENDRLTLSPILVKDLRSVFRGDDAHKTYLSMIGREVLVVRQRNDRAAFCFLGITFSSLESGVAVLSQDTFRPSSGVPFVITDYVAFGVRCHEIFLIPNPTIIA